MQDKLIGQIRLGLTQLEKDISRANQLLKERLGKEGGKDLTKLMAGLGVGTGSGTGGQNPDPNKNVREGIQLTQQELKKYGKLIQEVTAYDKEMNETSTTTKRVLNGLVTTIRENEKGLLGLKQETKNTVIEFQRSFNSIINTYGQLNVEQKKQPTNIQNTIQKLRELSKAYDIESNEVKKYTLKLQN